jgi:ribosomal protein S19
MKVYAQRKQKIVFALVGKTFLVYSGNVYKNILVTKEIVNFRFGDFVFTKKRGKDSKKK